MECLRTFLSDSHRRGMSNQGRLLDYPVTDPLLEERLSRIRIQVIAALALREVLGDMGFPLPHGFDLLPLIRLAKDHGIQSYREANILNDINDDANEAKHFLVFRCQKELATQLRAPRMEMECLRTFLSDAQQSVLLRQLRLLDHPVTDLLLEERLLRIRVQVIAALALREILAAMGYPLPCELDLLRLIQIGKDHGILNRREANILSDINSEANEAKHIVNFRSRM